MLKGIKQYGKELLAIAGSYKLLIPVIAIAIVPVLYSAMFLGAFWDPYGHLERLPVAVVNSDQGAEFNGKTLNIGDDFIDNLKYNSEFKWSFVTKEEAVSGMKDNKYYMTIEIPEDFSENTATLTSDRPTAATMRFMPNQSFNFLASQIGNSAVEKLKGSLNKEITEVYAETVFDQLEQLAGGIGQAGEGASKLADGSAQVKDGALRIKDNLRKLVSGSQSLQEGVSKLNAGSATLEQGGKELNTGAAALAGGLAQLVEAQQKLAAGATAASDGAASLASNARTLSGGLSQLSEGSATLAGNAGKAEQAAGQLATGLQQSEAGAAKLADSAQQLSDGLAALAQQNPQLAQDATFQQLLAGSKRLAAGIASSEDAQHQLNEGAAQLHEGLGQLNAGLAAFVGKLNEASAGSAQLADGSAQLAEGAKQLTDGMSLFGGKLAEARDGGAALASGAATLTDGAAALHSGLAQLESKTVPFVEGSSQLENGAAQLSNGLLQLDEGAHELSGKLGDAAAQTSSLKGSDSMYDMFAEPVRLDVQKLKEVPNYGTGLAPYFLSLGLYVGAMLLTIVYPVREPAGRPSSGWQWFWGKALTMVTVGTVQALIADAALLYILKLKVTDIPLFLLFSVLVSVTFMMIIQLLVTTMQNPGRFIAILILIFQLTSSAGTFPLELIPGWLQNVTPWLPMTYSVAGMKAVISSGDYGALQHNAVVLGGFAVLFAAATLAYLIVSHRKSSRQHPEAAQTA
ncbi:YhgE/Pip domain-containing protein [Paenibacillus thermotolerans]|uniref:YhgE/Pip domain-containing protein n=1 Tax=Paenibacillus thermotolerans TaxID=3027807 RepID=UPI002368B20E|nr:MULTISPECIES: YhgE/Pip domain-containing protein [unclassified Paenibacillus]